MYQQLMIVGNVGQDPEMRYMPDGAVVTNFSVAVNRKFKADDLSIEQTMWVRCSAWGRLAENCNRYLSSGDKVMVTGELQFNPATGGPKIYKRNDGTAGTSYEMKVEKIRFLSSRAERSNGSTPDLSTPPAAALANDNDDIPF